MEYYDGRLCVRPSELFENGIVTESIIAIGLTVTALRSPGVEAVPKTRMPL